MISITGLLILLLIVYLSKDIFSSMPAINPFGDGTNGTGAEGQPIVEGNFTPLTLVKYNGTDDAKILIAVRNKVYDVSNGASFYGPGGPYENFAGRDASRGLAKNSFELSCLTPINDKIDTLSNLTKDELESLNGWQEHFDNKYPVVGSLHENEP